MFINFKQGSRKAVAGYSAFVITILLLTACGSTSMEEPPTTNPQPPTATIQWTETLIPASPTPEPPKITGITIDGVADDWDAYQLAASDKAGDQVPGSPDLAEARAFNNDQYFYLLIREHLPGTTDHYDILLDVDGGDMDYQISVWPDRNEAVFAAFPVQGDMTPLESVTSAQRDEIEIKMPLSAVGNKPVLAFFVQTWLGDQVGDFMDQGKALILIDLEPTPFPADALSKPGPTRVEFTATDGQALVGYYYPSWKSNAPVVVLIHQFGLPQNNWVDYGIVDWLQNWPPPGEAVGVFPAMPIDQSFAIFTVDLRGFGESGPAIPNTLSDEEFKVYADGWIVDVASAMDYIRTLPNIDATRIAIIGANNGADASVASCGDCIGVLALSPGNYVNEDFKTTVEKLDADGKIVWCLSTENSAGADVATCNSLRGMHYRWVNFPGDGRGMELIRSDKAPKEIGQNILDFLTQTFGFTP